MRGYSITTIVAMLWVIVNQFSDSKMPEHCNHTLH